MCTYERVGTCACARTCVRTCARTCARACADLRAHACVQTCAPPARAFNTDILHFYIKLLTYRSNRKPEGESEMQF